MNKSLLFFIIFISVIVTNSMLDNAVFAQKADGKDEQQESISYSLGYLFGRNLISNGYNLDSQQLIEGLQSALTGKDSKFSNSTMSAFISTYNQEVENNRLERNKTLASANQKQADDYLNKNKDNPSIKVTDSGLQYIELTVGKGPKPKATDEVTVHYRGSVIDGREFDSSYSRNQPATFPLNRVIKGWTEGLQLMPVGSKFRFFIPPSLGYGQTPPPGSIIEPNSLLIFDVELLSIGG